MCRTTRLLADMVDNKNSDDSVNLFCSSSCVMAFKVQTVSISGTRQHVSMTILHSWTYYYFVIIIILFIGARMNCDSCGKNTVPAYHLAMSDTSIRNFCTLPCVMAFQVITGLLTVMTGLCSIRERLMNYKMCCQTTSEIKSVCDWSERAHFKSECSDLTASRLRVFSTDDLSYWLLGGSSCKYSWSQSGIFVIKW